jgi:hypothetical protein
MRIGIKLDFHTKGNKMACRICHSNSCTESFHSLEEQDMYEETPEGRLIPKQAPQPSSSKGLD